MAGKYLDQTGLEILVTLIKKYLSDNGGKVDNITIGDGSISLSNNDKKVNIPFASTSNSGLLTAGDKVQIDKITEMLASIVSNSNNITTLENGKVDKIEGKSLSTNDFTTALKSKLEGIATGANNKTYQFATGTENGTIAIGEDNGNKVNIAIKGLGSAAYTNTSTFATSAQGSKADKAMPKTGGTFTGKVTLANDPTTDLEAATKKYVDNLVKDIREVAEGKTKAYAIKTDSNFIDYAVDALDVSSIDSENILNLKLLSNESEISLTFSDDTFLFLYNDEAELITMDSSKLKIGDTFYIVDEDYPDRYIGAIARSSSMCTIDLYKLETSKVDLSSYALKSSLPSSIPDSDITKLFK